MCTAAGYGPGDICSATENIKATIEGIINLAVSETNHAYTVSNIGTRLRLVYVHYDATYNDVTNQWETTLGYLRNNNDGQLDYVHAMRDQYGADFVSMLVDTGSYCGIGYRPQNPSAGDAFSLTKWSCATGYFSFGHEIAHNMGCNHDRNNAGGGSAINYGFQSPSSRFRSIMAYDCPNGGCQRVGYFSNPDVRYQGSQIGDSGANNAKWIRDNMPAYANFRQSKPLSTPNTPPQTPTPAPTAAPRGPSAAPTNDDSLITVLSGGFIGGAGNMFDIRAKTDLSVTNFAMHSYAATEVTVEVWKKIAVGTCVGAQSDQSQWEAIGSATFESSQAYRASIMPPNSFPPVYIKEGDIQAFYVTFTAVTNYNRYSPGSKLGNVQSSNGDMDVLEGYVKGYRFGDDYAPRVWNGIVYYERGTIQQTPRPTPTKEPTKEPTLPPTKEPTLPPTLAPTLAPVVEPTTSEPTPIPTAPPTPEPTTAPPTPEPTPHLTPAPRPGPPTDSNQVVEQLTTLFAGGNGQAGNMIQIQASQDIIVTSFDIHTYSNLNVHVYIYSKPGTFVGFEHDMSAWTEICDTRVDGQGSPNPTNIPADAVTAVRVEAGETHSFYITLTDSSIRYTNGIITTDDGVIRFFRSSGNKYPFGADYPNRIWNGVVHYKTDAVQATPSPTPIPNSNNGPSKQLQTTFENRNGSYGNMFDIVAKEDLIIHNVWIHTYQQFGALVDVEVYKLIKPGKFFGHENSRVNWVKVGGAVVKGQGTGQATKLPPGSIKEISVAKGQTQALYVTIVGGGLRYSNGASANLQVFIENNDLKIYEGAGVGSPRFGSTFSPRVFNGVLEYYTPNVATITDVIPDQVNGKYDHFGGLKEEGWTCTDGDECKTGQCGKASTESETLSVGSETLSVGSISTLREKRGSNRRNNENVNFCLDENGQHMEDGSDNGEGTFRI